MRRSLMTFFAVLLAAMLAACGGGGGSAGTVVGGPASGGGTPTPTNPNATATASVTDFAVFTDKTTMNNSGTDRARLTVTTVNVNRNVVPGAIVQVSTDQNTVFVPTGSGNVTDATGNFTGDLTIGGDKSDRDVTLTVTVNNIVKRVSVRVSGSRLTLQATPSSPTPGQTVTFTATLVDSAGNAIPGVALTFGGNLSGLNGRRVVTGTAGTGSTVAAVPTAPGAYSASVSGGGVSSGDVQINVFDSLVPVAAIPVGAVPSLSASPNVLATNSAGSTTNRSTLRFLFLDTANRPVQNVRVRFEDRTTGLAAVGASLASGTSTLYTDASGSVTTQYIAGQNSSPTNGVTVRACYSATDFTSATDCPASVPVNLTIAGQALAVSIGDDNLLQRDGVTYIKTFAVTVADSAGRAVADAPVDISVDLTHYGKGRYGDVYLSNGTATSSLTVVPSSLTAAYPTLDTVPTATPTQRIWCPNEDTNRNGNVDPLENVNGSLDSTGQPTLEPRKSDLLVSYADPNVTRTNASGVLNIRVQYAQRFATWLAYRVRVTANVAGSQGLAERTFVTSFVEGDDENGGAFLNPAYGVGSCTQAN